MDTEKILAYYNEHRGAIKAAAGLLLAVLILVLGFSGYFYCNFDWCRILYREKDA